MQSFHIISYVALFAGQVQGLRTKVFAGLPDKLTPTSPGRSHSKEPPKAPLILPGSHEDGQYKHSTTDLKAIVEAILAQEQNDRSIFGSIKDGFWFGPQQRDPFKQSISIDDNPFLLIFEDLKKLVKRSENEETCLDYLNTIISLPENKRVRSPASKTVEGPEKSPNLEQNTVTALQSLQFIFNKAKMNEGFPRGVRYIEFVIKKSGVNPSEQLVAVLENLYLTWDSTEQERLHTASLYGSHPDRRANPASPEQSQWINRYLTGQLLTGINVDPGENLNHAKAKWNAEHGIAAHFHDDDSPIEELYRDILARLKQQDKNLYQDSNSGLLSKPAQFLDDVFSSEGSYSKKVFFKDLKDGFDRLGEFLSDRPNASSNNTVFLFQQQKAAEPIKFSVNPSASKVKIEAGRITFTHKDLQSQTHNITVEIARPLDVNMVMMPATTPLPGIGDGGGSTEESKKVESNFEDLFFVDHSFRRARLANIDARLVRAEKTGYPLRSLDGKYSVIYQQWTTLQPDKRERQALLKPSRISVRSADVYTKSEDLFFDILDEVRAQAITVNAKPEEYEPTKHVVSSLENVMSMNLQTLEKQLKDRTEPFDDIDDKLRKMKTAIYPIWKNLTRTKEQRERKLRFEGIINELSKELEQSQDSPAAAIEAKDFLEKIFQDDFHIDSALLRLEEGLNDMVGLVGQSHAAPLTLMYEIWKSIKLPEESKPNSTNSF